MPCKVEGGGKRRAHRQRYPHESLALPKEEVFFGGRYHKDLHDAPGDDGNSLLVITRGGGGCGELLIMSSTPFAILPLVGHTFGRRRSIISGSSDHVTTDGGPLLVVLPSATITLKGSRAEELRHDALCCAVCVTFLKRPPTQPFRSS